MPGFQPERRGFDSRRGCVLDHDVGSIRASQRMTPDRHLDWEGCFNARDLGGLPSADGREIRRGAIVRADSPDHLTAAGWGALEAYGIRTIIDLRNDDEQHPDRAPRPEAVTTVHLPLDGVEDREFWDHWGPRPPPLFYGPFLERFPERAAGVIAAIANAAPGGVLVHCVGGRDRTGLITLLLLALAGVEAEVIAADHAVSGERVAAVYVQRSIEADVDLASLLAREGTSAREVIISTVTSLDLESLLRGGGLTEDELAAVRARLLGP
jgi:protein-tyrosine phosphatase